MPDVTDDLICRLGSDTENAGTHTLFHFLPRQDTSGMLPTEQGWIDAHQHFGQLDRGDYGWLSPEKKAICRDFGPKDLAPLLAQADITKTVWVQAAPTTAETRFLLNLAT